MSKPMPMPMPMPNIAEANEWMHHISKISTSGNFSYWRCLRVVRNSPMANNYGHRFVLDFPANMCFLQYYLQYLTYFWAFFLWFCRFYLLFYSYFLIFVFFHPFFSSLSTFRGRFERSLQTEPENSVKSLFYALLFSWYLLK